MAAATQLTEEEMTPRDLRKARELTQAQIAEALHISQDGVSRIEKRSDLLLSTFRAYVEAMGGRLCLMAEFPNRKPVEIAGLDCMTAGAKPQRRGRKSVGRQR